jgi:hypothetical protein
VTVDHGTFWNAVDDKIDEGRRLVDKLGDFANIRAAVHGYIEEEDFTEELLRVLIEQVRQRILLMCDVACLNAFLANFGEGWKQFKNPTQLTLAPWIGVLYCPALEFLADCLNSIEVVVPRTEESARTSSDRMRILEQVLRGTSKIIWDRKLEPSKESEIRNAVYDVLIHVFPDTVREVPIAQVSKIYKPDIGVRSLKAAVEYKFADNESEARSLLGGIYEDIHGYAGSEDWKTFFAVLYMTGNFLTLDQVIAEWQMTNVPHSWKPIVVTGRGARKPKLKRAISAAKKDKKRTA